jgi:hypothetical protein
MIAFGNLPAGRDRRADSEEDACGVHMQVARDDLLICVDCKTRSTVTITLCSAGAPAREWRGGAKVGVVRTSREVLQVRQDCAQAMDAGEGARATKARARKLHCMKGLANGQRPSTGSAEGRKRMTDDNKESTNPMAHQTRHSPLAQSRFIWYKHFTESSVWLAGQILQLS